jgi:Tfp pilus assembly protein PilO
MKALFTYGAEVPFGRVIAEHRRWLWPVAIVLAINVAVLIGVVLPLRQSVENGEARAAASAQSLREAMDDLKNAEATRDGQSQASTDLDKFYADVLPANMTTARRTTHIKLAQLARSRGVDFQSGATSLETLRDSTLQRLRVNYSLSGNWDDIRQFIYEIETGPDFVVIDNVQLLEAQQNQGLSLQLDVSTFFRVGDGR